MQSKIIKIQSPGRICLFGDHQDYLGLPVIACAIDKYITLEAKPISKKLFKITMPDIGQERILDLNAAFDSRLKRDYFVAALHVLRRYGCIPNQGYQLKIQGEIPINAGLSSSSAIVVAWITFLLNAFGANKKINRELIAKLAYQTEVLEYQEPGGLMDQYTISLGNLLYLNTETGEHKHIDKKLDSLVIGESGVPKQTLKVLQNLRSYAEMSIKKVIEINPDFDLKEASIKDFKLYEKHLSTQLRPIFYAALKNYEITQKAFDQFQKKLLDLNKIGSLMTAHHQVLKDVLNITVPIIDHMISGALEKGALGAKIVGSGGGGSIVALVEQGNEAGVIKGMLQGGASAAYQVKIARGVQKL